MVATTAQSTPEKSNENSNEKGQGTGSGIDAKGLGASPANELGEAKNTQVDEFGYQVIRVDCPLLKIILPTGDELRTPAHAFEKALKTYFKF